MKTSELIKELQELDPNDECILCIDNHPIRYISKMPWYWDGRVEIISRNHAHIPIKAGYPNQGSKISFHYDTIEDVLIDNPDMGVGFKRDYPSRKSGRTIRQ